MFTIISSGWVSERALAIALRVLEVLQVLSVLGAVLSFFQVSNSSYSITGALIK